ncbi:hypothetical protein HON52_00125 [Candidatus Uhrbacteria bacterium]|nr:hypothetical protein [Candidatus Uhrbacteria bacterium]
MTDDELSIAEQLSECAQVMGMPECTIQGRPTSVFINKDINRWEGGVVNGKPIGKNLGRFSSHFEQELTHGPILDAINEASGCVDRCKVSGVETGNPSHYILYIDGSKKVGLCVKAGSIRRMDEPKYSYCY